MTLKHLGVRDLKITQPKYDKRAPIIMFIYSLRPRPAAMSFMQNNSDFQHFTVPLFLSVPKTTILSYYSSIITHLQHLSFIIINNMKVKQQQEKKFIHKFVWQ